MAGLKMNEKFQEVTPLQLMQKLLDRFENARSVSHHNSTPPQPHPKDPNPHSKALWIG